ncbi:GldG family protein [Verrucomicrobiota bacterium]
MNDRKSYDGGKERHMTRRLARRRLAMGFNAGVAVTLAAVLAAMVNYLSYKHGFRMDLSQSQYFTLSDRTSTLLGRLGADVHVTVFASSEHDLYGDMRHLLREYEYASNRLHVEYIDPNRDLAITKELALKYDVSEPNVVVFASEGKQKIVPVDEIADYDYLPMELGQAKKMTAFRGEQVFSSAIQSLTEVREPVVYFLAGHGERRIDSYDQYSGYSIIARALQRENMKVKALTLGDVSVIPDDCDVLVVAGPTKGLARGEIDIIEAYLDNAGCLFLLLDAGVAAGLDSLLEAWGVQVAEDRVVGPTLTGRELVVTQYGEHRITEHQNNVRTIFNLPRSIRPLTRDESSAVKPADKPRVTILASCSERGWAEMTPGQNPPTFDPEVDRPGPVSVAVAVEKGALRDMDVEIKPTRIVVVGDSAMVSNGALLAGYNTDFFLCALNWLLEREGSLVIATKEPVRLRIAMSLGQARLVYWITVVGVPAIVAVLGLIVWAVRRK